jgi:hypothetical protein
VCVAIPGETKIPSSAHRQIRHVEERYGLVWIWSGTDSPLFPLPTIPELDGTATGAASQYDICRYRVNIGSAPISRVQENGLDTMHLSELHKLSLKFVNCTVLERPCWDVGDPRRPAHADVGAWFGNIVEFQPQQYEGVDRISRFLDLPLDPVRVVVDHWPSGGVGRLEQGQYRHTIFGTASPYSSRGSGTLYAIAITPRHGTRIRDLTYHFLTTITQRWAVSQDIQMYRSLGSSYDGVLVKTDTPIKAYRRWYIGWVKATRDESELPGAHPERQRSRSAAQASRLRNGENLCRPARGSGWRR